MKTVILRTHKRTKSNSFLDALFRTLTVAPFVALFCKLATKPTKPIIVMGDKQIQKKLLICINLSI
jgi:ABC-type spermidine/putrescine transport system permease subunit I